MKNLHNVSVCIWHALMARGSKNSDTTHTFFEFTFSSQSTSHSYKFLWLYSFQKVHNAFISNKTDPYTNNQIYVKAILGFLP